MKLGGKWIAIIAVVGIIIIGGCTNNKFVALDENVDASWSNVETVLQRRYDLIPNLVNTVKGFADQEKEVLTEVTRLRSQWGAAKSQSEKVGIASALDSALGRLMVVVEKYPDIKSNQNFLALQTQLEGTENRISVERRRYNESVRAYNTGIRKFPGNMIASILGYEKREGFEADDAAQSAPEVKF